MKEIMVETNDSFRAFASQMRLDILDLAHRAGTFGAHLGGALSLVEILTVLYKNKLCFRAEDPMWSERDRVVISKAHASIALYAAMRGVGLLSEEEFNKPLYGETTFLFKHSRRDVVHGIEMSGGSLGQGLAYAAGIAEALCLRKSSARVYAIVGDGECNEGSIWETAAFIGHRRLTNIIVLIDKNGLQIDGRTQDVLNMDNMADRWSSFGFDVKEIDGHDFFSIQDALDNNCNARPLALVCNTVKGKGVSFVENDASWHQHYLSDDQYDVARKELYERT